MSDRSDDWIRRSLDDATGRLPVSPADPRRLAAATRRRRRERTVGGLGAVVVAAAVVAVALASTSGGTPRSVQVVGGASTTVVSSTVPSSTVPTSTTVVPTTAPVPPSTAPTTAPTSPTTTPVTATTIAGHQVLAPATVPPVAAECDLTLTHAVDGTVGPTGCPEVGVNVAAWDYYATVLSSHYGSFLALGPTATESTVLARMCRDEASLPTMEQVAGMTAAYYGWSFAADPRFAEWPFYPKPDGNECP